jgi:hypothetical protein
MEVDNYYSQDPNMKLLQKYKVAYVIGGKEPPGWKIAYQNATVTVYSP